MFLQRVDIESKPGGRIEKLEQQPMSIESVAVWIAQLKEHQVVSDSEE
jgi:hypothetical protein